MDTSQDPPPLPGYSIPIRAPLTLDSDSRTTSFNSTSSSIDSSFSDEHINILEQESSHLDAYPDEKTVIERPYVQESLFIRPFVRYPCEESSSIDVSSYGDEHISSLEQESSDFLAYPDQEIVIERSHGQECCIIRPFVTYPDANCVKESSSIDLSSYGDEHITNINNLEEESCDFVAYPDEEIVIERSCVEESLFFRPFVRYPDADNINFRPFVNVLCEEGSSGGFGPFGVKLSVPIARLTGDGDSNSDGDTGVDSVVRDDGIVQEVTVGPKVRSFSGNEGDVEVQCEGVVSSDDISGIENFGSVSTESVENEGCEVECLQEVLKVSVSDASSFDLERIDAVTVSSSNNEIETKLSESDEQSFDFEKIVAQIVSKADSEIENLSYVSPEEIETEVCKVKCLNEVMKVSVSDASSFDLEGIDALTVSSSNNEMEIERKLSEADALSFDSEAIDARIVSSSDSEIENLNHVSAEAKLSEADALRFLERIDKQIATIKGKLSGLDEPSFDSEQIDSQIASNPDSEIENLSYVSTESIANEGCKVEHLTEVVKLSKSDASSHHLERIEAQAASSSNKNEEEPPKKMQRMRTKFLRLALNEQLIFGEGNNSKFDFALTILVIGKTGVGKSATINSIFGENKAVTNAFEPSKTSIQEMTGNVDGVQLRVLDTPGLKCFYRDRGYNLRVLKSIKRFTRKHTPNVVLYVDRLDTLDVNNAPVLKLITSSLGSSVWNSCIIALTHAGCDLSDEPTRGFVVQRCRFLQEQIVSFGGNNRCVANPVWLVDNHPCYTHNVMDLNCGSKGLVCLDQADEDDGCDEVQPCEALSEARNVINSSRERREARSKEDAYRLKIVVNKHGFGFTW